MFNIEITDFATPKVIRFSPDDGISNLEEIFEGVAWEDLPGSHEPLTCYSQRTTTAIVREGDAVKIESRGAYGLVSVTDILYCENRLHTTEIDTTPKTEFTKYAQRYRRASFIGNYYRDPHDHRNVYL